MTYDSFDQKTKQDSLAWESAINRKIETNPAYKPETKVKKAVNTTAIIITLAFVSIIAFVVSNPNVNQVFTMLKGM